VKLTPRLTRYTGSFGTFGGSYLGYTQWAILTNPPKDYKVAVINSGPVDFGKMLWANGAMDSHVICWSDLMTAAKRGYTPGPAYVKKQPDLLRPVFDGVPLVDALDKHFERDMPEWLRRFVATPDLVDPFYRDMNQQAALERADIPILQMTGWNDMGLACVMEQYKSLSQRGLSTFITVGPWIQIPRQTSCRSWRGLQVFGSTDLCNWVEAMEGNPFMASNTDVKRRAFS
jgi:predicted acyl esterase